MKILYIIGNGFDLNLGLKTKYENFNDYYTNIKSSSKSINDLKENISSNYQNWSDFEIALGEYTDKFQTVNEFDEVFEDILQQLAGYLDQEESKFDFSKVDKNKFLENLVKPEKFLSVAETNKVRNFKKHYIDHNPWIIDIFTFNYTTTIEEILEEEERTMITGQHINPNSSVVIEGVNHIHGFINNRMILGVNDVSQLKNKDFHQNIDVLEAIVKKECNKAYGHMIDEQFKTKIDEADFICFFGVSLGDTDNVWWELIGEKLKKNNVPVIIFTKSENVISPRIGYKINRTKRVIKELFLKKTKLSEEEYNENIYIGLNTDMFKVL